MSDACPKCGRRTPPLVSDVDGSTEYVCPEHGAHADQDAAGGSPERREYLFARFDITDLNEAERDQLTLEVVVQAEASDYEDDGTGGHPDVEVETWKERGE